MLQENICLDDVLEGFQEPRPDEDVLGRLLDLSHYRPDNRVTPLVLEYLNWTQYFESDVVLRGMERHYKNGGHDQGRPRGDTYGLRR